MKTPLEITPARAGLEENKHETNSAISSVRESATLCSAAVPGERPDGFLAGRDPPQQKQIDNGFLQLPALRFQKLRLFLFYSKDRGRASSLIAVDMFVWLSTHKS